MSPNLSARSATFSSKPNSISLQNRVEGAFTEIFKEQDAKITIYYMARLIKRVQPDEKRLRAMPGPQLFRTRLGRLDVLKEAGGDTFASLGLDAQTAVLDGIPVRYASLTALLRMKRAANRRKDREGIRLIEEALRRTKG